MLLVHTLGEQRIAARRPERDDQRDLVSCSSRRRDLPPEILGEGAVYVRSRLDEREGNARPRLELLDRNRDPLVQLIRAVQVPPPPRPPTSFGRVIQFALARGKAGSCAAVTAPTQTTSRPIVVAGAHVQSLFLHVDAVPREGETVLGSGFEEPEDGGKATNQAVAIAKLGVPVRVVTVVGRDERGRRWRRILDRYGIDTRYMEEVDGATDVGFVMLPPSGIPAIVTSSELSLLLDDELVMRCADGYRDAAVVVCQFEAPQSGAVASFRLGRAAGAITILNPAPAQELDPELPGLIDVLVPNEHEAAVLAGSTAPPQELADRLCERNGCAVVVTAGADGCYCATPDELRLHVPAPAVRARDTTGAGDAFVGALAASLREGDTLTAAAAFATQAASVSVGRPGTMPSYPTRAELSSAPPMPATP